MKRLRSLDGVRGLASIWVVFYHFLYGVIVWVGGDKQVALQYTPTIINIQGVMAVHLFFIISGFVISMTAGRSHDVLDFAINRAARLYPAYWFAVIVATVIGILWPLPSMPIGWREGLVNMTMIQMYMHVRDVNPSFWSLALELSFYLMVALAIAMGWVRKLELVGFVWVLVNFFAFSLLPKIGLPLPTRLSPLLGLDVAPLFYIGILYFKMWSDRRTIGRLLGVVMCLAMLSSIFNPLEFGIEVGCCILMAHALSGRAHWLESRPMLFLGGISYSLYLMHAVIGIRLQLALHALGVPPGPALVAVLAIVITVATLVTHWIERPGGRLLHRVLARLRESWLPSPVHGRQLDIVRPEV